MNKRVMLAAPKSGSGKTVCTISLLAILKNMGIDVASVKSGPDYIDPMFHRRVLDMDSANLDTFFSSHEKIRTLYDDSHEMTVIEGVMGLFDGLGGVRDEGSSYDLALALEAPIILVVDCKGMARSVLALIKGFMDYDSHGLIKGVILNRMSAGYYPKLKELIEGELGIKVCGYVPYDKSLDIESRHLGLATPDTISDLKMQIDRASLIVKETLDIEAILELASIGAEASDKREAKKTAQAKRLDAVRLAVAMDEAFNFYYSENLRMLRDRGVELVYFSPLRDKQLPDNISGILLGGGYPELYASELSANRSMLDSIKAAGDNGMVIVAECGGYMYLCRAINTKEGQLASMVGLIDTMSSWKGKLVRFGYVDIEDETGYWLAKDVSVRGHEFHYYDCDDNGSGLRITKAASGISYQGGYISERLWASYAHLYYPSCEGFVDALVEKLSR